MGENKINSTMEEKKEPSYEQLKNWCDQLMMQRNQLAEKLEQVANVVNKLPWLFKVIENKNSFANEFVTACVEEITFILTPPAEEDEETKKDIGEEPKK